jgi:hypothetical protein
MWARASLPGLVHGRAIRYLGLLLAFLVLRSAFQGTLENPEPRYTLECYQSAPGEEVKADVGLSKTCI